MMKTLCVAAVVLSLSSVCQPASLACKKLPQPVDKDPDLTGSWRLIGMSSESFLFSMFFKYVLWPSLEVDYTHRDSPNDLDATAKIKVYGHCMNESTTFAYKNNTLSNGKRKKWQPCCTRCAAPDCLLMKEHSQYNSLLFLFSRRNTVNAAELKEFRTQAECLGLYDPVILSSNHEYENCRSFKNPDYKQIILKMFARLRDITENL